MNGARGRNRIGTKREYQRPHNVYFSKAYDEIGQIDTCPPSKNWSISWPMAKYLLTDAELRSMIPGEYHDGSGLWCVIRSKTSASWHLRYTVKRRPDLKRPKMGLGTYPTVSLARARELADQYRAIAAEGIDPKEHRRQATRRGMTVEQAITELFEKKKHALKGDGKAGGWMSPVANHIIPAIGNIGVADLTTALIVEKLGKVYIEQPQTGDKVFTRLKQALQYASAEDERVNAGIVEDAKVQLPRKKAVKKKRDDGHQPALDWKGECPVFCV